MLKWNTSYASHRTLIFFDEISHRTWDQIIRKEFDDIDQSDSGALICISPTEVDQRWYFPNGIQIDTHFEDYSTFLTTWSGRQVTPDLNRVERYPNRNRRLKNLVGSIYSGMWSCRYGTKGNIEGAVFVGVYAREGMLEGYIKQIKLEIHSIRKAHMHTAQTPLSAPNYHKNVGVISPQC